MKVSGGGQYKHNECKESCDRVDNQDGGKSRSRAGGKIKAAILIMVEEFGRVISNLDWAAFTSFAGSKDAKVSPCE